MQRQRMSIRLLMVMLLSSMLLPMKLLLIYPLDCSQEQGVVPRFEGLGDPTLGMKNLELHAGSRFRHCESVLHVLRF